MAFSFGRTSRARLDTCHADLIRVCERALAAGEIDFTIVSGHRSVEEQQKLHAQGRTEPGPIVTQVDGIHRKSRHNADPSEAVDIAPYVNGGIAWDDIGLFDRLAVLMKSAAEAEGVAIEWGGDWNSFKDRPHFQLG